MVSNLQLDLPLALRLALESSLKSFLHLLAVALDMELAFMSVFDADFLDVAHHFDEAAHAVGEHGQCQPQSAGLFGPLRRYHNVLGAGESAVPEFVGVVGNLEAVSEEVAVHHGVLGKWHPSGGSADLDFEVDLELEVVEEDVHGGVVDAVINFGRLEVFLEVVLKDGGLVVDDMAVDLEPELRGEFRDRSHLGGWNDCRVLHLCF